MEEFVWYEKDNTIVRRKTFSWLVCKTTFVGSKQNYMMWHEKYQAGKLTKKTKKQKTPQ